MAKNNPPPSSPAGVPTGGGGKFVVAAVALIGVVVAAVAWKKCQKDPGPPPVTFDAAPPPTNSGRNIDDDIPLPPPTEDAGPDAGKKVVVVQQGLASQCDAKKCSGQATPELETALQFRVKQAHRCYDNALAQDPTLRGKITVAVRIGANGQTCSASVASNDMSTPNVGQCVVNTYFRAANFPAPKNGCVDINVPVNFVPRQ